MVGFFAGSSGACLVGILVRVGRLMNWMVDWVPGDGQFVLFNWLVGLQRLQFSYFRVILLQIHSCGWFLCRVVLVFCILASPIMAFIPKTFNLFVSKKIVDQEAIQDLLDCEGLSAWVISYAKDPDGVRQDIFLAFTPIILFVIDQISDE